MANRRGPATAEPEAPEAPEKDPFAEMDPAAKIIYAKQAYDHLGLTDDRPEDDSDWLLAFDGLREKMEAKNAAPPPEETPPVPPAPELPPEMLEGLPPSVVAFIALQQQAAAAQAAQSQKLLEGMFAMVEKQAARTGKEIQLEGDVDALIEQMSGTVSAGPPPENPLPRPVVFVSKGAMFHAVRKPRYRNVGPNGEQYFTTGITYDFAPNGRFETVDPKAAEWLRKRPGMNVEYWEETAPPHTAPDPGVLMERIIDMALELDDAGLAALQTDEEASHKRPIVLSAIKRARRRIQGFQEQQED